MFIHIQQANMKTKEIKLNKKKLNEIQVNDLKICVIQAS